jgi:hypothetical protein
VDCASLALQVAPVSYYCLIFFIGLRPKLGNTYYHIMGRSPNSGRNSNIFHIINGLDSLHRKGYTGNQYMVKSAENRMRSNLEGCRTFRNLVVSYLDRVFRTGVNMYSETFRTFFSTHRFVINSFIKMLYA